MLCFAFCELFFVVNNNNTWQNFFPTVHAHYKGYSYVNYLLRDYAREITVNIWYILVFPVFVLQVFKLQQKNTYCNTQNQRYSLIVNDQHMHHLVLGEHYLV